RRELLEREARELDDDVIQDRLERCRRRLRDVVGQFVEQITNGELGADARNGETRRLRRERGRTGDARIHLHDEHLARLRVQRELDVAAARLDADLADDRYRGVAHLLVLDVRERLD